MLGTADLDLALACVPWDGEGVIMSVSGVARPRGRKCAPRTTCKGSGGARTHPEHGTLRGDSTEHSSSGDNQSPRTASVLVSKSGDDGLDHRHRVQVGQHTIR